MSASVLFLVIVSCYILHRYYRNPFFEAFVTAASDAGELVLAERDPQEDVGTLSGAQEFFCLHVFDSM
jgi:hypothetical protein